jgi:hypothetical protein
MPTFFINPDAEYTDTTTVSTEPKENYLFEMQCTTIDEAIQASHGIDRFVREAIEQYRYRCDDDIAREAHQEGYEEAEREYGAKVEKLEGKLDQRDDQIADLEEKLEDAETANGELRAQLQPFLDEQRTPGTAAHVQHAALAQMAAFYDTERKRYYTKAIETAKQIAALELLRISHDQLAGQVDDLKAANAALMREVSLARAATEKKSALSP